MRVRFVDIDGVPTRYYIAGNGPPLMLVHGGGVSADSWIRNLPELAERYTVVAPDTLAHGFTGPGSLDGGPPQPHMVRHLLAIADHLGWDRFAVCGSSFGAMLTMLVYFAAPERIDRLILLSSASATLTEEELEEKLQLAHANGMSAIRDPSWENCRQRMANINHTPEAAPPEVILMQMNIYAQPDAIRNYDLVMKGLMRTEEARPYRVAERFPEVAVPTLMIWGNDDRRVIMDRATDAAARLQDGYLVALSDCCHEPHMEQPAKFNRLVGDFLAGEDFSDLRPRPDAAVPVI